jgi:hypothetical protein
MKPLYIFTAAGFILLTLIFFSLFFRLLKSAIEQAPWSNQRKKKVTLRILLGLFIWAGLVGAASSSGFTSNFNNFPFNALPLLLIPLATTLSLIFSGGVKTILRHLSLKVLTQLQVFRVFVEILLWLLFIQNLLPEQMTFEGRNWDILTGITALVVSRYFLNSKGWMIVWNIFGLGLLINIVAVALLSMPTPFRYFENEPANTIVTIFPFILLPTFLVPLAYILHFISLRKLLMKP